MSIWRVIYRRIYWNINTTNLSLLSSVGNNENESFATKQGNSKNDNKIFETKRFSEHFRNHCIWILRGPNWGRHTFLIGGKGLRGTLGYLCFVSAGCNLADVKRCSAVLGFVENITMMYVVIRNFEMKQADHQLYQSCWRTFHNFIQQLMEV